jgi:hypothetical protein
LIYIRLKEGAGCKGGWMRYAFDYVIENNGIESESKYPYEAVQGGCKNDVNYRVASMESYSNVAPSEDVRYIT